MILLYSFSKLIPLQEQKSLSSFGKLRTKGFFNKLACRQWVDKGDQIVWTDAAFFCRSLAIFIPEYLPAKLVRLLLTAGHVFLHCLQTSPLRAGALAGIGNRILCICCGMHCKEQ